MLDITLGSGDFTAADTEALALLVTETPLEKQRSFARVNEVLGGALAEHAKKVDFKGRADQVLDVPTWGKLGAERLLFVGLGAEKLSPRSLRSGAATAARCAASAQSLSVILPEGNADLRAVAEGLSLGAYRFTKYLTGDRVPKQSLETAVIYKQRGRAGAGDRRAVALGEKIAQAVNIARDAVNEPPNELTPETMAALARRIAESGGLKVKVLDEKGIVKAGMNLHAAVGQGSAHPPRFIHLTYAPPSAKKTVVFVGKGLTFDSGGLCIKPAPGMGEMKSDMGGAAAVLGLMAALAHVRPRVAVHGIIGAAENMPDANAYRPADVLTSLDGKTVEVINTDAEGRLVLADALAYAVKLEPDLVVDAATLTGACVVALGKTCSAFYSTNERFAKDFEAAAERTGESFWRLPLLDELKEQLSSDIADLKHTGDRWGGSIIAALFLREFVGKVPWIHCDIAGPVLADKPRGIYPKGATGHPVLTFLEFVERLR